jgi:DNA-binding CsgD family transcriptional regulator
VRGYYSEGRRHLEKLMGGAPAGATDARTRARASQWLGVLLLFQGEKDRARTVLEDARAAALSANDPRTITVSLLCLGLHAKVSGAWHKSTPFLEEALDRSRQAGDAWGAARSVHDLGITALYARDHARAGRLLEEARAGYRALGDERSLAETLLWLGIATREHGEVFGAVALVRQALVLNRRLRDRRVITLGVDAVLWLVGDTAAPEDVRRLMAMNEALRQGMGFAHGVWDQTFFAPRIAALNDRLGDERAVAADTQGYAQSHEQMVELSLEVLDAAAPAGASRKETTGTSGRGMLSPRESEVLRLVAEGLANREIAGRLFIAERTVRYHLSSAFGKLGADNRTQAVALARRRNLL